MDCRVCHRSLVARTVWRSVTAGERKALLAQGMAVHHGRGLCSTDYNQARKAGTLIDFERTQVPRDLVLEEWLLGADRSRSDAYNVRMLAPRLGMTEHALEQAVVRLRNAGRLGTQVAAA